MTMDPMKLAKPIAHSMAKDLQKARWRALRQISVDQAYFLLRLYDDLISVGDLNWMESLSNRLERGQHYIAKHHEIDDPELAQEIANEMADDLRDMREMRGELLRDPLTIDRLRTAEEILMPCGIKLHLLDRLQTEEEVSLN